jgi:hypothetical protein
MRIRPVFACFLVAALPARAVVIGEPLARDGLVIAPSYQTGVQIDRMMRPPESVHLEADVRAHDNVNGFAEHDFIPYLTINYALTRDDNSTFKKSGLLYPMVGVNGPHYGAFAELTPGTYHLTYIISPPSSHGMLRHIEATGRVSEWFKPITGSWTFTYPEKTP